MNRLRIAYLLSAMVVVAIGTACNRSDETIGRVAVMTSDAACSAPADSGIDPAGVTAGQKLAAQFHCVGCHTSAFSGQPETAINGGYPSNITPDPETGIGCLDDKTVATAILDSVGPRGPLCGMPKYRSKLAGDAGADPEVVAQQIVEYLRTLTPVSNVVSGPCAAPVPDGGY